MCVRWNTVHDEHMCVWPNADASLHLYMSPCYFHQMFSAYSFIRFYLIMWVQFMFSYLFCICLWHRLQKHNTIAPMYQNDCFSLARIQMKIWFRTLHENRKWDFHMFFRSILCVARNKVCIFLYIFYTALFICSAFKANSISKYCWHNFCSMFYFITSIMHKQTISFSLSLYE